MRDLPPPRITVVVVSWHSAALISALRDNLRARARHPESLRFLLIDNTDGKDGDLEALSTHPDVVLRRTDPGGLVGSRGHAWGLNVAMGELAAPYTLIVDPDVCLFIDDWDERLPARLREREAIAIGAPYPFWKLGKYHDFPSPPFALFDTAALLALEPDWTPFSSHPLRRGVDFVGRLIVRLHRLGTRARLARSTRLRAVTRRLERFVGVCARDTGWRIARAARDRGARAICFPEIMESSALLDGFDTIPELRELATHYELFFDEGRPALAHRYSTGSYFWSTPRSRDVDHFDACVMAVGRHLSSADARVERGRPARPQ